MTSVVVRLIIGALTLTQLCALSVAAPQFASPKFRGQAAALRNVSVKELEAGLQATFQALLNLDASATTRRIVATEASLAESFQAMPKNDMGRLAPRAVRHLVHNYFAKEHGWQIHGLAPHGMQAEISEVHDVSILQAKAPALVEALVEARRTNHGLSLDDVVAMVVTLERLIIDESVEILRVAYNLNKVSSSVNVAEEVMHQILTSYLLVVELGGRVDYDDAKAHENMKWTMQMSDSIWPMMVQFESDALKNYAFQRRAEMNPFGPQQYSFQAASQIVESLANGYGKWQNMECRQMRDELMALSAEKNGRVPISRFYSHSDGAEYQFTESVEYLREIGALEEAKGEPKVRIANYMVGPSNCIATSSYYSVCCLNDCESLMNEIEGQVKAPFAAPKQLLNVVSNISSSTVDAPRQLSADMAKKLQDIASRNEGTIPLHGRLFAQWMHLAYPNECPFPHLVEDTKTLTPSHWQDRLVLTSTYERRRIAEEADTSEPSGQQELPWSDHEVLPLLEPKKNNRMLSAVRAIAFLAVAVVVVRTALAASQAISASMAGGTALLRKKNEICENLPF